MGLAKGEDYIISCMVFDLTHSNFSLYMYMSMSIYAPIYTLSLLKCCALLDLARNALVMFNCCGRFIWLKRAGLGGLGWTGRCLVSGVYCIMQIDAAGQIESQLDGPSGLSPGVLLHPVSTSKVPAARGPQAFELPCMPETLIGRRPRRY